MTNKACPGKITSHFTTMVWKETTQLNCGHATNLIYSMNKYFVVCQYFVKGNFGGAEDYERQVGDPLVEVESCDTLTDIQTHAEDGDKSQAGGDTKSDSVTNTESEKEQAKPETDSITESESKSDKEAEKEVDNKVDNKEEDSQDHQTVKSGCKTDLTDWEQFVLDEHNKLRGQHADTPDMCYSESGSHVTFTSQTWADQLAATGMFQHSRGEYGENIAYKSTSGTLPDRIAAYNISIHRLETC